MNTKALNSLADLILRAQKQDRTPMGIAFAVDAAGRHMSPETAAELVRLTDRVAELETSARGCDGEGCVLPHSSWCTRAREFAAQHSGCTCGEPWKDTPQTHAGHCWLLSPPWDEMEWHRKRVAELLTRVAELEAERHTTNEALSDAAEQLRQDRDRIVELEAERGTAVADRDAQIIAWLGKKSREYGTSNREARDKAEAVGRMADKLRRGAVRRPHEDGYVSPLQQDHKISHDLPEVPHA